MKHESEELEISAVGPKLSTKPLVSDVDERKPKIPIPKGKKQILTTLIIVVLVVAGIYALYVWRKNVQQKARDQASVSQLVVDLNSPAGMIAGLKQKADELNTKQKAYSVQEETGPSSREGRVLYKSADSAFMVESKSQPSAGFSFKITPTGEGDSKQKKASEKLRDTANGLGKYSEDRLGLKKIDTVTYKANSNDTRTVYSNGVIYCSIPEIPDGQLKNLDVDCVTKEKIDEATAEIKHFIARDLAAGGKQYEQYMKPERSNGTTDFFIMKIAVDTSEKLYYIQYAGNPTWIALGAFSTRQPESCSRFESNSDAKTAFAGQEDCTDGGTVRKVR